MAFFLLEVLITQLCRSFEGTALLGCASWWLTAGLWLCWSAGASVALLGVTFWARTALTELLKVCCKVCTATAAACAHMTHMERGCLQMRECACCDFESA